MGALDPRLAHPLDTLVPPRPSPDGWSMIVADAALARRRWLPRVAVALPIAAAAALALALAWPFGGSSGGVLERALAAVDDGPVLHVVFREGWGGAVVDLQTGESRRLSGAREVWYDPERGIHTVSRLGGQAQGEALYPPGQVRFEDKTFAVLAIGYREALESGKARLLGPDELDGVPVYWIRVDAEWNEDVADGKLHEWAHDVAVSRTTYEPVGTRETLDGKNSPDGPARIVSFETLPEGEGDFSAQPDPLNGMAIVCCGFGQTIALDQADDVLGRTPLWLGGQFAGLPLARVTKGDQRAKPRGATEWDRMATVDLFYGLVTADGKPDLSQPHVRVQEAPRAHPALVHGYVPPEGKALVGGRGAIAHLDGLFVTIEAAIGKDSADNAIAAARALQPLP
jgi:hypothetical protein